MPDDPCLIIEILGPMSEGANPHFSHREGSRPLLIDVRTASGQKVLKILPSAVQQLAAAISLHLQAGGSP